MLTCVVCEAKPATTLDADGDRVCGECKDIAVELLKNCPELSEPVECINCGAPKCEDALCMAERQATQDAMDADDGEDDRTTFDMSDDADALASAGWGTDEDYGYYGDE